MQGLIFTLDDKKYALRLESVDRVVRSAEITPAPSAPEIILGVINLHGKIAAVLDVRRRFGLPPYEPSPYHQMLVARTATRTVLLPVDSVMGLIDCTAHQIVEGPSIAPGLEYVAGVTTIDGGIVFIHDLDRFLSLDEEHRLAEALDREDGSAE